MTKKQLERELQKLSKRWINDIMCEQWVEEVMKLIEKYKKGIK